MLPPVLRHLTYLTAVLYALLGAILFCASAWSSSRFAWKVSPFVTMTLGAWCLGNAWSAWVTAKRWQWWLIRTALIYLWMFGVLQFAVLVVFRDKLALAHPIAWLYVATISFNAITAAWGFIELIRLRPTAEPAGEKISSTLRVLTLTFVVLVAFLGLYGVSVAMGARGTNGTIFPELMSLFTLRSFSVFYLALALSSVPLLWARNIETLLHHALAQYGLLVIITVATFAYIDLFSFSERPLGLLYIGAYVVVGAVVGLIMLRYGTGHRATHLATGSA